MPPPGHEPFLRAICADPADDTVRLAYADWLDENGDPTRAEFIRLQIAVPDRPAESDPDLRFFRAMMLFAVHRAKWMGDLPTWAGVEWHAEPRRGFVCGAVFRSGRCWAGRRVQAARTVPLQHLGLRDASATTLARALDCPQAERLTDLALLNRRPVEDACLAVANCPRLGELRRLWLQRPNARGRLGHAALTTDEAHALVRSPNVPNLATIHVNAPVRPDAEKVLGGRFTVVRCRPGYRE